MFRRCFAAWMVLAVIVLLPGCRRTGPVEEPGNASSRLAERLLGVPAEMTLFVDIAGIRRDPKYGPLLGHRRVGALGGDRELRWLVTRVDRVDVWVVGLDRSGADVSGLAVLRGGRLGEADLGAGGLGLDLERRLVLPSGVVMFVLGTGSVPSAVFLVDGSLVLAAGAAIAPVQLHYTDARSLPPPLDGGRDALLGIYGRRPALRRIGSPADGASAASFVWRTSRHGDLVASASFDDDAGTERAMRWANELPDARGERLQRCPGLAVMGIRIAQARRTVTVRVTGLPELLAAVLDDRLCPD